MLHRDLLWGLTPATIKSSNYCTKEYTEETIGKLVKLSDWILCPHSQQADAHLILTLTIKLVRNRVNTLNNKMRGIETKRKSQILQAADTEKLDMLMVTFRDEEYRLKQALITLFIRTAEEMIKNYDFSERALPSFGFKILSIVIAQIANIHVPLHISVLDLMVELTVLAKNSAREALLPTIFTFVQLPLVADTHSQKIIHMIHSKLKDQYAELVPSTQSSIQAFASAFFLALVCLDRLDREVTSIFTIYPIVDTVTMDDLLVLLRLGPDTLGCGRNMTKVKDGIIRIEVLLLSMTFYAQYRDGMISDAPRSEVHSDLNFDSSTAAIATVTTNMQYPEYIYANVEICRAISSKLAPSVQSIIRCIAEHPHIFRYLDKDSKFDLSATNLQVKEAPEVATDLYSDVCAGAFSEHGFVSTRDTYHIVSWTLAFAAVELFWMTILFVDFRQLKLIDCHRIVKDANLILRTLAPVFHKKVLSSCSRTSFQRFITIIASNFCSFEPYNMAQIMLDSIKRTLLGLIGNTDVPTSRGGGALPTFIVGFVNGIAEILHDHPNHKDMVEYEFLLQSNIGFDQSSKESSCSRHHYHGDDNQSNKASPFRSDAAALRPDDCYGYLTRLSYDVINALLRKMATLRLLKKASDVRPVVHSMLVFHLLFLESNTPFEYKVFSRVAGELTILLDLYGEENYLLKCAGFSALVGLMSRVARQVAKNKRYHIEDLLANNVIRKATYMLQSDVGTFSFLQLMTSCAPSQTRVSFLQDSYPHVLSKLLMCLSSPNIHIRIAVARAIPAIFSPGAAGLMRFFEKLKTLPELSLNGLHGLIITCRVFLRPHSVFKEGRGHSLLAVTKLNPETVSMCKPLIEAFLSQYEQSIRALVRAKVGTYDLAGLVDDLTVEKQHHIVTCAKQ